MSLHESFPDHVAMVEAMELGVPIGNEQLRQRLEWGHVRRFTRVRDSLVGVNVIKRLPYGRGGRLELTTVDLSFLTEAEEELAPGRERALYAPLVPIVDSLIESQYVDALPVDEDCVHVYRTAEQGARDTGGRLTRADLTVLVNLRLPSLGPWLDIHAVEVKPYWSIGRDGLYEAAAQAAMQRCSHSWLVAYIPGPQVSLADASRTKAESALALIRGPLSEEAEELGLGLAVVASLRADSPAEIIRQPRRQVLNPSRVDEMLGVLGSAES
jgi:hypothetical protein